MATLDEVMNNQQLTVDYSEDPESVMTAQQNLQGLEKEPISVPDLSQIITLPTSPAVKRNAIASGLDGGGRLSEVLTDRLNNIIPESEAAKESYRQNSNIIQAMLADKIQTRQQMAKLTSEQVLLSQSYAAMKAQEAAGIIQRGGVDVGDINSAVNVAAIQQPDLYLQMNSLKKEIQKKSQASFLDDPTTWLMNQFTVGDDVKKHNQLADQFNQNESFISSAPAAIRTAIDSNAPKFTAMSSLEAQNLAQQRLISAQTDIADIQSEAAKAGIQTTKDLQGINTAATGQLLTAETRSLAEKDRALAAQDRARNMDRLDEESKDRAFQRGELLKIAKDNAEVRRLKDEQKQDELETQRKRDSYVAAALPGYNITTEKQLKALPPKQRAQLEGIVNSYDESLGYAKLGATPVDVLSNAQGMRKSFVGANSYQQQMVESMAVIAKKYETDTTTQGMKPEEIALNKNKAILKDIKLWQDNPTTLGPVMRDGEQWKAYNVAPIIETASRSSMAGNKFAQELVKLNSTLPPGTDVSASMALTSLAKDAVANKNISQIAKDVSEFYQYGLLVNNLTLTPDRFALPKQETFNVPLKTGVFGGTQKYDLASQKGATLALAQMYLKSSTDPGSIMDVSKLVADMNAKKKDNQ